MKKCYFFLFFLFLFLPEGLICQNISGIINTYSSVTGIECDITVTVTDPTIFMPNDRALIIQMKGAKIDTTNSSNFGRVQNVLNTGNFEFVTIKEIKENKVKFYNPLLNKYSTNGSVQLVRVPVYRDARVSGTLSVPAWNGSIYGVLAIELSGTLTLASDINVDGKGFRGGEYSIPGSGNGINDYCLPYPTGRGGRKGEGIAEYDPIRDAGAGPLANGGGGGNSFNLGGGGGSNAGAGGNGGHGDLSIPGNAATTHALGGLAINYNSGFTKVFMGGGGGGGHQNGGNGTAGANGGGIVIIKAAGINGNNYTISANGNSVTSIANTDGAGGGGGGGAILLDVRDIANELNLSVCGGSGGTVSSGADGAGGGGGGGVIWFSGDFPSDANNRYVGGFQGISSGGDNGAAGSDGNVLTGLKIPQANDFKQPVSLSDNTIDFGAILCKTDSTRFLMVKNISQDVVKFSRIYKLHDDPSFSVTGGSSVVTLNPASEHELTIKFHPSSFGLFSDTLVLENMNKCVPDIYVVLKGKKEDINITLSGLNNDTLDFGEFCSDTVKDTNFLIMNLSEMEADITVDTLLPPFYLTNPNEFPAKLSSKEYRSVRINISTKDLSGEYIQRIVLKDSCGNEYLVVLKAVVNTIHASINPADSIIICEGESRTLTALPLNPACTYLWNNGQTTPSINVDNAGIYSVVIENASGCIDSAKIRVDVVPKLEASIKASASTEVCGDSIVLTAQPTSAFYKYRWSTGETSPAITARSSGGYYVIVETGSGCSDSAFIRIIINPKPKAEIESSGNFSICEGDSIVLKCKNTDTFIWSTGETSAEIIVKQTGRYYLAVENTFGCRDTAFVQIEVKSLPYAKIIPDGATSICNGESLIMNAGSPDPANTYYWSNGMYGNNITINRAGKYYLQVSNSIGCISIDSITITETPPLDLKILPGRDLHICNGHMIGLSTEKEYASYLWSNGETTRNIMVSSPGVYKLTVTDNNGCTGTDSCVITLSVINIDFLDMQNTKFDSVYIETRISKKISIQNRGNDVLSVVTIGFANENRAFSIISDPPVPATVGRGEAIDFYLTFSPDELGEYSDSIEIQLTNPCFIKYSIPVNGIGIYKMRVWLPDIDGEISKKYNIPLKIKGYSELSKPLKFDYKAVLKYDLMALLPNIPECSPLEACFIENGERIFVINDTAIELDENEKKICNLSCTPLITKEKSVVMKIDSFIVSHPYIVVDTSWGSFQIRDICVANLSRIKMMLDYSSLQILPNPAGESVTMHVISDETGQFSISIYTIHGQYMETIKWSRAATDKGTKEFILDMSRYTDDMYQVVLTSPSSRRSYPLLISK